MADSDDIERATRRLQELQRTIGRRGRPDAFDEEAEKLYFAEIQGRLHVEFYGSPFDESFEEFLGLLMDPGVAAALRALSFRGPDEGANGTRNWDFTRLLDSDAVFPHLTSLFVEPTAPEHHNQTVLGSEYEEEGQTGRWLAKAPALEALTVPSAPDESFFAAGPRPLALLRVDTGYDHQNFIRNLSDSSAFPALRRLDFGDYNQRYMPDWEASCTPFDDYARLFRSAAFARVGHFTLRNARLSHEQLQDLHALCPEVQFYVIQSHGEYVR